MCLICEGVKRKLGRHTVRAFHELFQSARRHPIYWLYGLEVQLDTMMSRYRKRIKRTLSLDRRREFEAKVQAIGQCKKMVRSEIRRFQSLPENRKSEIKNRK